jgi:hypothetical protein
MLQGENPEAHGQCKAVVISTLLSVLPTRNIHAAFAAGMHKTSQQLISA